jgi:hypothetical protein
MVSKLHFIHEPNKYQENIILKKTPISTQTMHLTSTINHKHNDTTNIETNDRDFPIVQYVDDTLLILPANKDQLLASKEVLHKFSNSTGLKINFDKSQMVPINVPEDDLKQLAVDFGCQIGKMPFTYLGFPLGTMKPTITELSPLVCRLERKLSVQAFSPKVLDYS